MVSAGIPVQKDGIKRLTCSYQNWEQQDCMYPGTLGKGDATTYEISKVVQGMTNDNKPGTPVGWLRERFEDSDIALAQLDNGIHFENQFFEPLETNPKVLLALEDVDFGDEFLVDTFPGGAGDACGLVWFSQSQWISTWVGHEWSVRIRRQARLHKGLP